MDTPKHSRGGWRPGAGRKKHLDVNAQKVMVLLDPEHCAIVDSWRHAQGCELSRSDAVRAILSKVGLKKQRTKNGSGIKVPGTPDKPTSAGG